MQPSATRQARSDDDDARRLLHVIRALEGAGVRWWIDHGTLLGIVRDGCLLPWDDDIDIAFVDTALGDVRRALLRARVSLSARLVTTCRGVRIVPYEPGARSIDLAPYRMIDDATYQKRLVRVMPDDDARGRRRFDALRRIGRHIDGVLGRLERRFWQGRRVPTGAAFSVLWFTSAVAIARDMVAGVRTSRVPAEYFSSLEERVWNGLRLVLPVDAERYLVFRYGEDWEVPRQQWSWWEDDQTVSAC